MAYINNKANRKPTKFEEMSKEQIRQAILKKRECNAKAQNTVECLLERHVSEDFFLQCLSLINQSHFEDVVEERAIIQVCGYPLCPNTLSTKDIPKQTYRISLKTNKVYDITARKSFCSNSCYKSAMYIKKQMLTSPLWFREYEDMPNFNLLPLDTVGSLGQEVDVAIVENIDDKCTTVKHFTSINEFASASISEIDKDSAEITCNNIFIDSKSPKDNSRLDTEVATSSNEEERSIQDDIAKEHKKQPTNKALNIVGDIIERSGKTIDPILQNVPNEINSMQGKEAKDITQKNIAATKKKQPLVTLLAIEVEKCVAEWFTIETMLLLFGEVKVREMLADKGECIKEYINNYPASLFYNSNNYDQYQALCKKLNVLELEDKRFNSQSMKKESKPLPDYTMLQEESKKMQLKVRAFFTGQTEVPSTDLSKEKTVENENSETTSFTQLPLVDKHAQNALRRRIVCEHLNKVLPDILKSLGLLSVSITSDVRLLVNTFKLKATNIMFKPVQWALIAIIVVKLLSLRDKRLEHLLDQPTAYQHLQLLLLSYKQDGGYLDRLISWLTDIDRLLDTNDTQLTI